MKTTAEQKNDLQLNNHYTAHVFTYRRDEDTGSYQLLLGQKSVVSFHLVIEYLNYPHEFDKRIQKILNIQTCEIKNQLRKLGYIFNSTSSGKYITPGGQPLKNVKEDPKDTAAREWIEEVVNLFADNRIKIDELKDKIKQNLVELYKWQDKYDNTKYGVIYGLNIDALIKIAPEIAFITRQKEISAVNIKLMKFQYSLMNKCKYPNTPSDATFCHINEIPEFELIVWVNFRDLSSYIYAKDKRVQQTFLNWLQILFPIYNSKARQLFDVLQIKNVYDLSDHLSSYLNNYDVSFISRALHRLNVILSHRDATKMNKINDIGVGLELVNQASTVTCSQASLDVPPEFTDEELAELNESFRAMSLPAILRAGKSQSNSQPQTLPTIITECQTDNNITEQQKLSFNLRPR